MKLRTRKKRERGFVLVAVLAVVAGITIVIAIGLDRRAGDASLEGRTLCRAAAKSAAESAMARAQSKLAGGGVPSALQGKLDGGRHTEVAYTLEISRSQGAITATAEGSCRHRDDADPVRHQVRAKLDPQGRALEWVEDHQAQSSEQRAR